MSLLDSISSMFTTVKDVCVEHSPEILTVAGAASIIAGTVIAVKQSAKAVEVLDNRNETLVDLEMAHETEDNYTDKQYKKDIASVNRRAVISLGKMYVGPSLMVLGGIAAMGGATYIEHSRLADATAEVGILTGTIATMCTNAEKILGPGGADKIKYGIETKTKQKVEEYDPETGKIKTVTKDIDVADDPCKYSRYAFLIDPDTTPEWDPNEDFTLAFIRGVEAMANDRLRYDKQHKLVLNDVRQMFSLEYTQDGARAGWDMKNKNGDGKVIFRITKVYRETKDDFGVPTGKYHASFIVDPNVDGNIFNGMLDDRFRLPEDVVDVA